MLENDAQDKIAHFNYPQQRAWIVNANTTVAIFGRGTGKTHGVISPVALRNVQGLPRGATAFVNATYVKIDNDLLPAMTDSLEKFGFYENIDYWVGKYIPKNIDHVLPFQYPKDPSKSVFWRNGHIFRLIGLDTKTSGNAQSNDFIIGDETKFIKQEAFNSRIVPTNRGNEDVPAFASKHYHHGILFCTDMPTSPEAQWILDYEQEMNEKQIDLIVSYDHAQREYVLQMADELLASNPGLSQQIRFDKEQLLVTMEDLLLKGRLTEALDKRFRKELARLDGILFELRREAVYFVEASTLDNIDVVTTRYIRQMKRALTPKQFKSSILNIREVGADFAFYGNFDEVKHTYTDVDYSYYDLFKSATMPQPWKKDGDIDTLRGLEIACDWNAKIVCMEVGQEFLHAYKILNSLEVKHPQRIKHLARKFDEYYKLYPIKKVTHYYDHTAIGVDASREISYAEELKQELTALGWRVEDRYIGQAATHESRYKMWARIHAEDDPFTKPVRMNRNNCENLMKSVQDAGVRETHKGHQKDKRTEQSTVIPPEHSTHHTDAMDTLIIGVFQARLGHDEYEPDIVF